VRALFRVAAGLVIVAAAVAAWIWVTTNLDTASGPGWQLAGAGRGGPWSFNAENPMHAEIVTEQSSLDELWSSIPLASTPPEPDFSRQVVVRATGFGSGSCPLHFDGLELAADRMVARMSKGFWLACSGDANPYSFLILVERDRLPVDPFPILVETDSGSTEVVVDSVP
jgi:hypothetical protein